VSARWTDRKETAATSLLQIYLHDINDTPLLSVQEERKLAAKVAMGDRSAREQMVKANLRLVVNIARSYLGKGLGLEDLIEEGNLGLMRAVESFDGTMDTRFSTYASYWIKQSIRRAVINQGKPIRLPAYMVGLLAKWRRATTILADRFGRAPTNEEVGKALRISKKRMGVVAKAIRANNLTPHHDGSDDDGPPLDDVLTDNRGKGPESVLIEADDLRRIFLQLDRLEEREATVIRMRFGLGPNSPMSLREVGERLGLTRERVRQLESNALRKLIGSVAQTDRSGGK
jgi:RNA polymerase primary sigma factor